MILNNIEDCINIIKILESVDFIDDFNVEYKLNIEELKNKVK